MAWNTPRYLSVRIGRSIRAEVGGMLVGALQREQQSSWPRASASVPAIGRAPDFYGLMRATAHATQRRPSGPSGANTCSSHA